VNAVQRLSEGSAPLKRANRQRVLVATGDVLEPKMAGPAIRAWQIALALSREHDVHLVSTLACALEHSDFAVSFAEDSDITRLVDWCDIVVFQGNLMALHGALRTTDKVVVVDVYDPFHLEVLEQARDLDTMHRGLTTRATREVINQQLRRGDFFLCASEKQRDFWLGHLASVGRVNPITYDDDESLETLIDVVPFGTSDAAPVHTRSVVRGVVYGIDEHSKLILWGGGVYNWFDPLTLLRAVDKLRTRIPEVRLYFLGLQHPNPHVGEMRMAIDTRALADDLGLTGTHVFFNEDWVEYDDRQNYLLESDVGVSTHLDHVETRFSFRTRILDYFWAGLPVVATAGDALADLIDAHGLGLTVPAGNVDALEEALHRLLADGAFAEACRGASLAQAQHLRWSDVLAPLVEFCRAPRRAPDLVDPITRELATEPPRGMARLRRDIEIAIAAVRKGNFRELFERIGTRLRRLFTVGAN
jgi:glycosyltransferase involved in cell wall biosynthesis